MTVFVDASAFIAIIAGEDGADALDADPDRLCSAMSVWETVAGLCRSHGYAIPQAREQVQRFLDAGAFRSVAVGEREGRHRGRRLRPVRQGPPPPAALNMGECFAHACAKAHGAKTALQGRGLPQDRPDLAGQESRPPLRPPPPAC